MGSRKEVILQMINELFGDTSVPVEKTLDEIMEIKEECEVLIEAMQSDLI